jgi:hypothetical protein
MVIISIAIIITYVQPKFADINKVQDDIGVYQQERTQVESVNAKLESLMARVDRVPVSDQLKLVTYMPEEIDNISVQRDLLFITQEAGVFYIGSKYLDEGIDINSRSRNQSDAMSTPNKFGLSVEGTYGQVKNLFALMEQNEYPLEISNVEIRDSEGDFLTVDIEIDVYTFKPPFNR